MMAGQQKKMKQYTTSVERKLNLPRGIKARVMTDFMTSIAARREAGQSDEAIYAELGSPEKVAAELNEQMKEYAYIKSPWRFVFLAGAVVSGGWLAFYGVMQLVALHLMISGRQASMGIIGGADGPTSIFVTTTVGFDWDIAVMAVVLVVGILGFLRLRRCRTKK